MSVYDRPIITRGLEVDEMCVERSGDGRTIEARALTYGVPYLVSDDGGRSTYHEVWRPGVFTKTLAQRGGRIPLLVGHERRRLPIGATLGDVGDPDAFIFRAKVSRTRDGDEALELIQDGALTGVSVGARIMNEARRHDGTVERIEARLEEISLSAFQQMADAHVLAVRADLGDTDDEYLATVNDTREALEAALQILNTPRPWEDAS